ncbi:MAG: type III-A CRISPR-associated RAMP protein Csm4 [Bacteroidetes bacterium]|nr:type III-A CRISPR-associated RAMP protein Csm4 [Bacteroidota bacterium]
MKTIFHVFRLAFNAPLHISDTRLDYGISARIVHSDTLYAAIISALARTGKLTKDVEKTGDMGCTISSLFPYTTANDQFIYFFPRPFLPVKFVNFPIELNKKLKKVKWLDQDFFESVIRGEIIQWKNDDEYQISGDFLSMHDLKDIPIINYQTVPRARIPRSREENQGDTVIFYMERVFFTSGSGLYFLASGDLSLLENGLEILQHEGIGTDRNVGQGTFTVHKASTLELTLPKFTGYIATLGLLCPESAQISTLIDGSEIGNCIPRWDLIQRGGWLTSESETGIRKKSVFMISEGSILKHDIDFPLGVVNIDLKPDEIEGLIPPTHPVWRCGRTLCVPVNPSTE